MEHSKVADESLEWKVKLAPLLASAVAGCVSMTVFGGTVSMTSVPDGPAVVFPAGSLAEVVSVCEPSAIVEDDVQLQLPLASTVAVQTTVPSTVTLTVLPGSPVPVNVGLCVPW